MHPDSKLGERGLHTVFYSNVPFSFVFNPFLCLPLLQVSLPPPTPPTPPTPGIFSLPSSSIQILLILLDLSNVTFFKKVTLQLNLSCPLQCSYAEHTQKYATISGKKDDTNKVLLCIQDF